jgi:hypothetical protein
MTDKTAARVKKIMGMVKARRVGGEGVPVVAREAELDRAITDMGCDPDDPEQYLALSVILLNAHFQPHYAPDWIAKENPKWTVRLYAMLLIDIAEIRHRNQKLRLNSLCKALLKRGRKQGAGLWRGMHGTGVENLRKRAAVALRTPEVVARVVAHFEARRPANILAEIQRVKESMGALAAELKQGQGKPIPDAAPGPEKSGTSKHPKSKRKDKSR